MSAEKLEKIAPYEPILDTLLKQFYDKLQSTEFIQLSKLNETPLPISGGLYVFYDGEIPIYVGRTKNIRNRIQQHTRISSKHESATFVFNLTKMHFRNIGNEILFKNENNKNRTRAQLMEVLEFRSTFDLQKNKLRTMQLKFIEEEHDILQTIIEPYLALKLKTYPNYNTFETH